MLPLQSGLHIQAFFLCSLAKCFTSGPQIYPAQIGSCHDPFPHRKVAGHLTLSHSKNEVRLYPICQGPNALFTEKLASACEDPCDLHQGAR